MEVYEEVQPTPDKLNESMDVKSDLRKMEEFMNRKISYQEEIF